MKAVQHGSMPPCKHEGSTWGQAVSAALKCTGRETNIRDLSIMIDAMKNGEHVLHDGVLFKRGR